MLQLLIAVADMGTRDYARAAFTDIDINDALTSLLSSANYGQRKRSQRRNDHFGKVAFIIPTVYVRHSFIRFHRVTFSFHKDSISMVNKDTNGVCHLIKQQLSCQTI
ncbi:hypothetical protein K439DRAFT_678890 [Ramaria rubella]|nr:hypothetical protein K439DRAFT_678890 [Ramaria rubella]